MPQDARGLLCMANSGPDSNASQFYITLRPCPHLTSSHVCFGRLVHGDDALDPDQFMQLPYTNQKHGMQQIAQSLAN